jgi:transaldolase
VTLTHDFKVKIFADGADIKGIEEFSRNPLVKGFTTNPTLMRAAGVTDYEEFAREVVRRVPVHPISFEVFSDEFDEMYVQALRIASWGTNVYVKIPVTNTRGESSAALVKELSARGVKVNVTAILALEQVERMVEALSADTPACISVFAGRVADTGRDPIPLMVRSLKLLEARPAAELIWASPREILNVIQAGEIGCHIITVTHELLRKLVTVGRDLSDYSLDTVRMFRRDALAAGFFLPVEPTPAVMVAHGD